jgi:tetratricopeptide (TPR) repeat protein
MAGGLSDAVRLFAERGESADPGFRVTDQNAEAVTEICRRLDGLPLGIELAAARLRSFSPEEISARLSDRFALLTGGARTSQPRQQTLRAAVDWSYDLLSEVERMLFGRLSVFADGFTLDAVEAVCDQESRVIVDTVIRLVEQSMVAPGERSGGTTRYHLLETLRQYGQQRLLERGDDAATRSRHAEYFSALAERSTSHLRGPDQATWMERLAAEHENGRAALDWSRDAENVETYLRLVAGWGDFWVKYGQWVEGRRRLGEALDLERGEHPKLRLGVLLTLTHVFVADDLGRASSLAQEALNLSVQHGDMEAKVDALTLSGYTAMHRNEFEESCRLLEEALRLARDEGMDYQRARALLNLGNLFARRSYDKARSYLEEGLALHRKLQDTSGIGQALHYLGAAAFNSGDLDNAVAWLAEGLDVDALIGGRDNSGHLLLTLGDARRLQGVPDQAIEHLRNGLQILTDAGDERCVARTHTRLGLISLAGESFTEASDLLTTSLQASADIGDTSNVELALDGLASLAAATGKPEQAALLFSAAQTIRDESGMPAASIRLARRDRDLESVRQELGPSTFQSSWERGSAIPIEEVVSVATDLRPA